MGWREVADPGAAFLEPESLDAPGVAVAATLEGSRPLLVEVQALVAPAAHGSPRRTATGIDSQRLALLLAVLGAARRASTSASHDVYASVVGGLSIDEPALDLPLALALASALRDRPIAPGRCCGRDRADRRVAPGPGLARRLREASRLGFTRAIVPRHADREQEPTRRPPIEHGRGSPRCARRSPPRLAAADPDSRSWRTSRLAVMRGR